MSLMHYILLKNFLKLGVTNHNQILDVGCGAGDLVHYLRVSGYNAFGIDVEFKYGKNKTQLIKQGLIKKIEIGGKTRGNLESGDKYIWPEFTNLFDVIVSRAVIEHVRNLDEFVYSSQKIMKEGGICIHYYPSKYSFIEPHIGVPFGGILMNRKWIIFMCYIGICFRSKRKKGSDAYCYMKNFTSYRKQVEIDKTFEMNGFQRVDALSPLQCHPNKLLNLIGRLRFANEIFSIFRSRVVVYRLVKK